MKSKPLETTWELLCFKNWWLSWIQGDFHSQGLYNVSFPVVFCSQVEILPGWKQMNLSGLLPYGWAQLQDWQRAALCEVLDFCTTCALHFPHVRAMGLTPAKKFLPCCLHGACAVEALEANTGLLLNFDLEQWDTRAFQTMSKNTYGWWWSWGSFSPNKSAAFSKTRGKSGDLFGLKLSSRRALHQ